MVKCLTDLITNRLERDQRTVIAFVHLSPKKLVILMCLRLEEDKIT